MEMVIFQNYDQLSRVAAAIVAATIQNKPDSVLGLPTGSTPLGIYKELIRLHRESGLDFSKVKTFNLDEYVGLGKDMGLSYAHDQSYARFMWEEFFGHINIAEANIHILDGLATNLAKACADYESEIRECGGIDLQLLGIGRDGHIGFNEPGSPLDSRTRIVELDKRTISDNFNKFFKQTGGSKQKMPKRAVSMGISTILEAKEIVLLANGGEKADVVSRLVDGPISTDLPASALQLCSDRVLVMVDSLAAGKLHNSVARQ